MAFIDAGACECGGASQNEFATLGAQCSRNTTTKRTGNASYAGNLNIASANATFHTWGEAQRSSVTAGKAWVVASVYLPNYPVGETAIGPFYNDLAGGGQPALIGITTAGYIQIRSALNNTLATGSVAVGTGAWKTLLCEYDNGADTVKVWVWNTGTSAWDSLISYSHGADITNSNTIRMIWGFQNLKSSAGLSLTVYTDDVFFNDDTGTTCNTKPAGPADIYAGFPNASATVQYDGWTIRAGGTDKYLEIDDTATGDADGDTTYLKSGTGTAQVKQTVDMTDGLVSGTKAIQAVCAAGVSRVNSGANGAANLLVYADGTDKTGAEFATTDVAYYLGGAVQMTTTPAGNAWTAALVNSMEIGAVRAAAATNPRDFWLTDIHCIVAECDMEAAEPPPAAPSIVGWKTLLGVGQG